MSQATASTEDLRFHLEGNFAPVFEELTEFDLEVSGAIPPELDGLFFRDGSNPQSGFSVHWFMDRVIIDAANFDKPPVARIQIPARVPFGFHGSWIADGV